MPAIASGPEPRASPSSTVSAWSSSVWPSSTRDAPVSRSASSNAAYRFLARGFSPARYWEAEQRGEQVALVRRVLAAPVLFDEVDVEGLVIAWNFRAEGRKLSDAVGAWPDYS
jgi:hypothetical protein